MDKGRPTLIHELDMKSCLKNNNASRKIHVADGEIFCVRCNKGRKPIPDSICLHRNKQNRPVIKGICSTCEGKLYRITNDREAEEKIKQLKTPSHRLYTLSCNANRTAINHYHAEDFITQYNAISGRFKFRYFDYLKEAKGFSDKSLKTISANILRCERLLEFAELSGFDREMAKTLKRKIKAESKSVYTACGAIRHFKDFLLWLKQHPSYKAKLHYHDIEYLNVTRNDKNSLGYKRFICYPSVDEIIEAITNMPSKYTKAKA